MKQFYQNLKLTNKLSFLLMVALFFSFIVLGLYFDSFLKRDYYESTQKRMIHIIDRLRSSIATVENNLKRRITFAETDEGLLASIDLINNYQNKMNYNAILLDEEKKSIAEKLKDSIKLSLHSSIALYDKTGDLITYVTKEDQGLYLHYIAYAKGKPLLFHKHENSETYTNTPFQDEALTPYQHKSFYTDPQVTKKTLISYHLDHSILSITGHRHIIEGNENKILAHIEISHKFQKSFFDLLSKNLDVSFKLSSTHADEKIAHALFEPQGYQDLILKQTENSYESILKLPTREGPLYISLLLDKAPLQEALNNNRKQFFLIFIFLIIAILFTMRALMKKGLAEPLDTLMEQIYKIDQRDYTPSEELATGDELQTISQNINDLSNTILARESALHKSQENFIFLSNHDTLTNLPNRRFFKQKLDDALDRAYKTQEKLAIMFLDLDQFKEVNDALGHDIGDELLVAVAERLSAALQEHDTLARIGGDEFLLLAEHVTSVEDLKTLLEKITHDIQAPFICSEHEIKTSVSIGIALYPNNGKDAVTLIKHADLAMYQSKAKGRNLYTFFSQELSQELFEQLQQTQALKKAVIDFSEFHLLYQPKVSIETGKIVAVEALIRWESSELGFLPPDLFIPLAEQTKLIIPLGAWILNRACEDFVALSKHSIHLDIMSINVSSIQLIHSDFQKTLIDMFNTIEIEPKHIELEITESYIINDKTQALQTLQAIRNMGISIAIDDFGTGYSSLSYLQRLPVTRLKIDKSFVDHLPDSVQSVAIAKAIIALAHTFNLSITAEGVETQTQLEFLKEAGCHEIQGYIYAKPMPLEELKAFSLTFNQ